MESKADKAWEDEQRLICSKAEKHSDDVEREVKVNVVKSRQCADSKQFIIPQMIQYFHSNYDHQDEDVQELFDFEIECWSKFNPEIEEYTLEHTALHQAFVRLFETKVEKFLDQRGMEQEHLYATLRQELELDTTMSALALAQAKQSSSDEDHHEDMKEYRSLPQSQVAQLLRIFHQVLDFTCWAEDMKKAVSDQRRRNCDLD